MKPLRILQIINEEISNWFKDDDQSSLDAYSNKFLSTTAPPKAPSTAPSQPKVDGELIGYVDKQWKEKLKEPIPVYKNPRSLTGINVAARGVLLNNSDLYLAPLPNAMHDNILDMLSEKGIVPYAKTYEYFTYFPDEFIAVQRVGNTNIFTQSSAYEKFPEYYEEIFRIANNKHPFQFKAHPTGNNLNELESPLDPMNQYSNIPPGYDANILYEKSDDIYGNKNRGVLKRTGKLFWIGTVNVYDGEIEEVHTYEEARNNDFHHHFYFSSAQVEKMVEGNVMIFWINADGIQAEWTMGKASPDIVNKIRKQIEINMETDKVQNVVKDVLKEFVNENLEEKYYTWRDKTGRGEKPIRLTKSHIEKTWDLNETDRDGEITLGEYLNESYIGDVWETESERLECIEIH
jgi:hypothetical protein